MSQAVEQAEEDKLDDPDSHPLKKFGTMRGTSNSLAENETNKGRTMSMQSPALQRRVKGAIQNIKENINPQYFQKQAQDVQKIQLQGSAQSYGEEAMFVDHYSATYYSMITKYKKKYHLLSEEQSQYYFEALFLLFIQAFFCYAILTSDEFKWELVLKYQDDYQLQLCLYFSSMILHFGSIYMVRNGITMIKYVIYHSEEFEHPKSAFFLGFLVTCVNILCELTNLFNSLSQKTVTNVISKFVAFKILIQMQDYYTRSRANFRIKSAVATPLIIVTDTDRVIGLAESSESNSHSTRNM